MVEDKMAFYRQKLKRIGYSIIRSAGHERVLKDMMSEKDMGDLYNELSQLIKSDYYLEQQSAKDRDK